MLAFSTQSACKMDDAKKIIIVKKQYQKFYISFTKYNQHRLHQFHKKKKTQITPKTKKKKNQDQTLYGDRNLNLFFLQNINSFSGLFSFHRNTHGPFELAVVGNLANCETLAKPSSPFLFFVTNLHQAKNK